MAKAGMTTMVPTQLQMLTKWLEQLMKAAIVVPELVVSLTAPSVLDGITSPYEDALPLGKLNARERISR